MLIAALFAVAKTRNQPKDPPTDEWIKDNGILLSYKNKLNLVICYSKHGWTQYIMLSKINKTEKDKNKQKIIQSEKESLPSPKKEKETEKEMLIELQRL